MSRWQRSPSVTLSRWIEAIAPAVLSCWIEAIALCHFESLDRSDRLDAGIDKAIKSTYIKEGTAQNQTVIYDMCTRFFRWASDRLGQNVIIAFITIDRLSTLRLLMASVSASIASLIMSTSLILNRM